MGQTGGKRTFSGPFVITGLSGAGKSVLSRSLEDIGYTCVDNIPLDLVPLLFDRTEGDMNRLVVVLDIRTKGMIQRFPDFYRELKEKFTDGSSQVLSQAASALRKLPAMMLPVSCRLDRSSAPSSEPV